MTAFTLRENIGILAKMKDFILDTWSCSGDMLIGVRGLMNDYYVKDIGEKVRAGYRQKQREGLVITPPFSYWKDKNDGRIKIVPEAAEAVRMICFLYLKGAGLKEIARKLNQKAFKNTCAAEI